MAVKHGSHVDKEDVILPQHGFAAGAVAEDLERILPETHQQRMPRKFHAQFCQHCFPDVLRFALTHAGPDRGCNPVDRAP